MSNNQQPEEHCVGRDKVLIYDDKVVILAANEMDWPLREFCRPPIYFRGCKLYLREKSPAEAPYVMRYELWGWPENLHEESPHSVLYDEAYVQDRDAEAAREKFHARGRGFLVWFYPLLGFLWSSCKEKHLVPFGIRAISATRMSIALAFNLMILEGVFAGWLGRGLLAAAFDDRDVIVIDWIALFALGLDSLFRYSQLLHGEAQYPWGFFEWAAFWRKGKNAA